MLLSLQVVLGDKCVSECRDSPHFSPYSLSVSLFNWIGFFTINVSLGICISVIVREINSRQNMSWGELFKCHVEGGRYFYYKSMINKLFRDTYGISKCILFPVKSPFKNLDKTELNQKTQNKHTLAQTPPVTLCLCCRRSKSCVVSVVFEVVWAVRAERDVNRLYG